MTAIPGYFLNNTFISESDTPIPEGRPVLVTVLDNKPTDEQAEAKRQKAIFSEFYAAIQADSDVLGEQFDKVLDNRIKFREIDF